MVGQILPMRRRPQFIISTGRQASHSLSGFQTQNVTGQGGAVGIQTHHMKQKSELPLILGGHSFIAQLGSDPLASEEEQLKIVEGCLEHGIRWFDTTYRPERVALGRVLAALGRRDDATVLAWNFFTDFLPGELVGDAACYRPELIEIILEELGTTYVDCLVMVPAKDPEENQRQKELLIDWQTKGYVRALGLWISDLRQIEEQQGWDFVPICNPTLQCRDEEGGPNFRILQAPGVGNARHVTICSWVGAGTAGCESVISRAWRCREPETDAGRSDVAVFVVSARRRSGHSRYEKGAMGEL